MESLQHGLFFTPHGKGAVNEVGDDSIKTFFNAVIRSLEVGQKQLLKLLNVLKTLLKKFLYTFLKGMLILVVSMLATNGGSWDYVCSFKNRV